VYLLYPYYKNIGKRLIKSPKLFFCDTALAAYLLGIHDKETLLKSPSFGHLFETMIINDVLKRFLNFGQMPAMYYLRTRDGLEIDLVLEINQKLHLFEIKSAMTITPKHASALIKIAHEQKPAVETAAIISRANKNFSINNRVNNYNWKNALSP
jgi:predicted AAA+ superfamily ATPase